ncbi:hypothetical protein ACFXPR_20650 [Nocardia tengchongensis]|uniref:hypothetical protein n=1 Tax=Nocardia tengchongensis TaxID=2055889 RepID=UPI0036C76141
MSTVEQTASDRVRAADIVTMCGRKGIAHAGLWLRVSRGEMVHVGAVLEKHTYIDGVAMQAALAAPADVI